MAIAQTLAHSLAPRAVGFWGALGPEGPFARHVHFMELGNHREPPN